MSSSLTLLPAHQLELNVAIRGIYSAAMNIRECWTTSPRFWLWVALAFMSACGSNPAGASKNVTAERFIGTWKGIAKAQACSSEQTAACPGGFMLAAFQLTLSTDNTEQLSGSLTIGTNRLTVSGHVDSGGDLRLTGSGAGIFQKVSLTDVRARAIGPALTGSAIMEMRSTLTPPVMSVINLSLEQVFRSDTPEASMPLPIELRFAMRILPTISGTVRTGTGTWVEYYACFSIDNPAPMIAHLTWIVTPIGSDGQDYEVQQLANSDSVQPANTLSGCSGGARDLQSRPSAPKYRLRMEYRYDDGVAGVFEAVAPVSAT